MTRSHTFTMRDAHGYDAEINAEFDYHEEQDQFYNSSGDPGTQGGITIRLRSYQINPQECDPEFSTNSDEVQQWLEENYNEED